MAYNIFQGSLLSPTRVTLPRTTKLVAVFPDGTESEITHNITCQLYSVRLPGGGRDSNSRLGDLKYFLEVDFPGVTFEKRKV